MRLFVVLTAAGSGTRLGCDMPKALVPVADRPLLEWALKGLPSCDFVVVSAPLEQVDRFQSVVSGCGIPAAVVPGGSSRQGSVAAAIRALVNMVDPVQDDDLVLVHDAARPFAPPAVFDRVVAALQDGHRAVVPALPVTDTIKVVAPRTRPDEPVEVVTATPNRATLRAVQTPQGFYLHELAALHQRFAERSLAESTSFSDDAALYETVGLPVVTVDGDRLAYKITTPADLTLAEFQHSPHH
nr:2-C-methyl-D-erythritol 4-phosphate cytidylyltransferase [Mobiluncus sp. Marseille-Q7826]